MTTKTSTRRQPTEAQKHAAQERRERIRKIAKTISGMSVEQREQMVAKFGGILSIEGRRLSLYNTCLLFMQREDVSTVGGFNQWKAAGRSVRKGERALAIWIPTGKGEEPATDDVDADADSDQRQRFILGNVFDITQTDEIEEA